MNLNKLKILIYSILKEIIVGDNISTIQDYETKIKEENNKIVKPRWLYKGVYYNNSKLVRKLVHDYIVDNDIKNILDIPEDIRNFKMYSQKLIVDENNKILKDYTYTKIEANDLEVYVRSICKRDNTKEFIKLLKGYYEFILETVEEYCG